LGCVSAGVYLLLLTIKVVLSLRYAQKIKSLESDVKSIVSVDSVYGLNEGVYQYVPDDFAMTIMQPILSGDSMLETCLRYNLELFQHYSFIWLVDEDDAEGLTLAKKLADEFSNVTLIYCPPVPQHVNPKVFKLNKGFPHVKTPLLAILDDDTCLSRNSLEVAQRHLKDADVYTGLPYYPLGKNFCSSLLAQFVNDNSALTYLPILNFTQAFSLNGMFYVLRCDRLQQAGGFAAIQHQLTDDYAMAKLIRQHQGKIIQGVTTQGVQSSIENLHHYISVMHRWFLFASLQIAEQQGKVRFLLFVFLILPSVLWMISLIGFGSSLWGLAILLIFLYARFLLLRRLQHQLISKTPSSFVMSFLVECFQPLHMLHALLVKRIKWRKRLIRVNRDGTFSYSRDSL
jgi:ceramide glucosyltransferase